MVALWLAVESSTDVPLITHATPCSISSYRYAFRQRLFSSAMLLKYSIRFHHHQPQYKVGCIPLLHRMYGGSEKESEITMMMMLPITLLFFFFSSSPIQTQQRHIIFLSSPQKYTIPRIQLFQLLKHTIIEERERERVEIMMGDDLPIDLLPFKHRLSPRFYEAREQVNSFIQNDVIPRLPEWNR